MALCTLTDLFRTGITTGNHEYDDGMYANVEGHDNGQLHIGADDSATIYINGEEIGQTTVDQWVRDMQLPVHLLASC